MITIVVDINGFRHEMTMEEAKELYESLESIFKEEITEIHHHYDCYPHGWLANNGPEVWYVPHQSVTITG